MTDFERYASPYSWRYGRPEMRAIWSELKNRRTWRKLWLAFAETQAEFGIVSDEQVADIREHVSEVNLEKSLAIEAEIRHDLMAELEVFAEQCKVGGRILHLGATAMDIKDNADVLRIREALDLTLNSLSDALAQLAGQIEKWAETTIMAYTHLQPAEPSTLGYRLAQYGQDLLADWNNLTSLRGRLRGKGLRGAVGTGATFAELMGIEQLPAFEKRLQEQLGLPFYPVVNQTYPRKQDYELVAALAGLGASVHKFAFDLRILQMPPMGELGEPFGEKQVGSSAMPFKRNPIRAEKMVSLARSLAQMPRVAWDNAAHSLLERTLDDSANRRTLLPEAFLIVDELLTSFAQIIGGLQVNEEAIAKNLNTYGPFAASERVLVALTKAGGDRQALHARLREHALQAWEAVQKGEENPLVDLICKDKTFVELLPARELEGLMQVRDYVGDAPKRAREFAASIKENLNGQ